MRVVSAGFTPCHVTNVATGDDMHILITAVGSAVVMVLVRWWQSPWCAVCYRGWAWRTRLVQKAWGVPEMMHVCGRCAGEIDRRAYGG